MENTKIIYVVTISRVFHQILILLLTDPLGLPSGLVVRASPSNAGMRGGPLVGDLRSHITNSTSGHLLAALELDETMSFAVVIEMGTKRHGTSRWKL